MKIVFVPDAMKFECDAQNAPVTLCAPIYRYRDGEEKMLTRLAEEGLCFADKENRAELIIEARENGLFRIVRRWTNLTDHPVELQTTLRVRLNYAPTHWLIPCVSINGNQFGAGGEPKGMDLDGKKWIFAYDRVSIPSCTLTETADIACGLFTDASDEASLVSSCSVFRDEEGKICQEIHHPVIEAPLTYVGRDVNGPAYETFLTIEAGATLETVSWLVISRPRWENYGIADVMDRALELFGDNADLVVPEKKTVWDNSITFARSLVSDYKGKKGIYIGYRWDGEQKAFVFRGDINFELAWCGQNILFSRMFIEDYIQYGREDSLALALEILDTRAELCTAKSGLLAAQLRHFENLDEAAADTCNMGYGAYEFLRCWQRLQEIGIDRPAYLTAAKGLCDFFCEHFSPETGFGKAWRLNGECLDSGGSIGAFVILPMAKLYGLTGEKKYLDMADRALRFYAERDLDRFVCTAGALDTCCVDKETSAPFLMSAILLYEQTGDKYYLTVAEKAAYYFTSWMFHYQPVYEEDTDIIRHGVCVKGLTSVSAQHHHLDPYGGIVVPYLRKLATYLGKEQWNVYAEMLWRAVLQGIGDGKLTIHDVIRPVGSQNEALFHCRWTFSGMPRGWLNNWLVAWPCAFRLSVLASEFWTEENKPI